MFNQDYPMNTDFFPETNLAGWRTSILCPAIQAFFPIDTEPGNANANPALQKCPEEIEDIANRTWESQDSTLELTFMTSALSLSEHSTLQSKFDWIFYSNMESSGI